MTPSEKIDPYKGRILPPGTTWRSFWPIWLAIAGYGFWKMMKG